MSKKSFKDINPALQFITQEVQEVQDTQEVQEVQRTQGRKGQKLPRINMAFQLDNLEYLQIISRIEGKSITDYVNKLVESDRINKAEIIETAKTLLKG
jgi:enhancing lycopene biosynthesis protein 2